MNDNISDAVIINDDVEFVEIPFDDNVEVPVDDLAENTDEEIGVPLDNPDTEKELTDEEKRVLKIQYLKESRIRFKSVRSNGKVTTNQYNNDYRKNRQRKNKTQKKSRKINRK